MVYLKHLIKVLFWTVVTIICGGMLLYALVDMFVILSTIVWVHRQ